MKYFIASLLAITTGLTLQAQQLQTSSMYEMQGVFHNPSVAGTLKHSMAGITYRSQWSGISGSPKTATAFASVDAPKLGLGLGGYVYSDKTGPTSRTGLQLSIAKHIATPNGGRISFGIETRLQQYAIDRSKLTQTLGSDPVLGGGDSKMKFDAGLGISYTNDKFQVGAAASQLIQSKLDFYTGSLTPGQEGRLYRHYYFHGKYNWDVDGSTKIIPHFLVIYLPNAPTEFQGGFRVEHNNLLWWGLGLRARQSFTLSAGVHVNKNFTIGYAFDIYKTPLSLFDNGSNAHEVLLRYNFVK